MDTTVDVASRLYEVLSRYVNEEEALQAFKPIDILDKTVFTEDEVGWRDEGGSRSRLQEEVALKLSKLGFSILKFKEAPFNIIAKRNGDRKTLLILTLEALSDKFKEELEVLRGVAEVAKVKRLVVTRKASREDGVISAKELDDMSSPEELIEVASSG